VAARPEPPPPRPQQNLDGRVAAAKGWGYLVAKLAEDGLGHARVERAFADPRMPPFEGLFFAVEPREPAALYRGLLRPRSVADARACRAENGRALESAQSATGVPAEVVAAILHVETRCGRNTGESVVLHGLARLAMANEPRNLAANLARRAGAGGRVEPDLEARVRARAETLEATFYPEVRAAFELAAAEGHDPLSLVGSPSGAFGVPQFLPTSYLRYGADGDGDGRVDLFDVDDAAASAARYLAEHGWRRGLPRSEQRRVLWHYNRSEAYIDAVLGLADRMAPPPRAAGAAREGGGGTRRPIQIEVAQ
jgi:membrane-bound lytic murein transglycosylase B